MQQSQLTIKIHCPFHAICKQRTINYSYKRVGFDSNQNSRFTKTCFKIKFKKLLFKTNQAQKISLQSPGAQRGVFEGDGCYELCRRSPVAKVLAEGAGVRARNSLGLVAYLPKLRIFAIFKVIFRHFFHSIS